MQYTGNMVILECAVCHITFGITAETSAKLYESGEGFSCPNGHKNYFKKTIKDELEQKELEIKGQEKMIQEKNDHISDLIDEIHEYKWSGKTNVYSVFSQNTADKLYDQGIKFLEDLLGYTLEDIRSMEGIGPRRLDELRDALKDGNMTFYQHLFGKEDGMEV